MKIGDIVICIDNSSRFISELGEILSKQLTVGKEYKIIGVAIQTEPHCISIMNNDNEEVIYLKERFSKNKRRKKFIDSL